MLKFFRKKIEKSYDKKIDGIGLAIFRIFYSFILLLEIKELYFFRHLVYDKIPYLEESEINFALPLLMWAASVCFILIGFKTRLATVINYILSLICIGVITTYEYHMFFIYMSVNLLLIFVPVSKCFSIDSLFQNLKSHFANQTPPSKKVSSINYKILLFVCLGFVYFDSVLFKLTNDAWLNGIGVWLPSSLPMVTHFDSSWLMNNKWIAYFLSHLTLVFELLFIFLFWFRWARIPLLVIGVILHLGILVEYPIPLFALGVISIYTLLVPNFFWRKFIKKSSEQNFSFLEKIVGKNRLKNIIALNDRIFPQSYQKENKLNDPLKKIKLNFITFGIIGLIMMQSMVSYSSPLIVNFRKQIKFHNTSLDNFFASCSYQTKKITRRLFGITSHNVFLDFHYKDYNHIVTIAFEDSDGNETWLPLTDKNGMPTGYSTGFVWAKWTWRINSPLANQNKLAKGIRDFTAFWSKKNGVDLSNAKFKVFVKKIEIATKWEKDFLIKQISRPWEEVGEVEWKDYVFYPSIPVIENL